MAKKYNFDQIANRRHSTSLKWDVNDDALPMWVADMDFMPMPEIQDAVIKAAQEQGYGYTYPTEDLFNAYHEWWRKRHDVIIPIEHMIYASGVVASLDTMVRELTKVNDGILLLTPVYHTFYNVIRNNKRNVVTSELKKDGSNYYINYQDVENKIKNFHVKALIFCNPHNPVGRIWQKEEIQMLFDICKRYNVLFISDEIHCDIVNPGYCYCSALKVSDEIIACLSPGKAFNLAGIQSSIVVIANKFVRAQVQNALYRDDVGEPNYFAIPAVIAAYTYGTDYIDELNQYLFDNKIYVFNFLREYLPQIKLVSGPATYLLWLDVSYLNKRSDILAEELKEETGLIVSPGWQFGQNAAGYLRINIATSLANVKDGMNRLYQYIKKQEENK